MMTSAAQSLPCPLCQAEGPHRISADDAGMLLWCTRCHRVTILAMAPPEDTLQAATAPQPHRP